MHDMQDDTKKQEDFLPDESMTHLSDESMTDDIVWDEDDFRDACMEIRDSLIKKMSVTDRRVVALYNEGFTQGDIAKTICKSPETVKKSYDNLRKLTSCKNIFRTKVNNGLDFGYQNPSALVLIESYEGVIYVDEWVYQSKLTTSDLIEEMKNLGVGRSAEIFADCAAPAAIEEIRRAGFNIKESEKMCWKEFGLLNQSH